MVMSMSLVNADSLPSPSPLFLPVRVFSTFAPSHPSPDHRWCATRYSVRSNHKGTVWANIAISMLKYHAQTIQTRKYFSLGNRQRAIVHLSKSY